MLHVTCAWRQPSYDCPAGTSWGQEGDPCVTSGQAVLGSCQAALAQLNPIYPLSSTEPATDVQIDNGYVALKIGQQPTDPCCIDAMQFADSGCAGDPSFVSLVLPSTGIQSQGLNSTLLILDLACTSGT
ncbi:hypothetical protein ABPG77_008555 [Micractinium sp. CCAP 211/92]